MGHALPAPSFGLRSSLRLEARIVLRHRPGILQALFRSRLIATKITAPMNATMIDQIMPRPDQPPIARRSSQPYVGIDKPTKTCVITPTGAPTPHLETIVTVGIRLS